MSCTLFGPFNGPVPAILRHARQQGDCRLFGSSPGIDVPVPRDTTWEQLHAALPADQVVERLVLWLGSADVPTRLWEAPVPIIGWAPAWRQHWHWLRRVAGHCDLLLSDYQGTDHLHREGITQARPALLRGLPEAVLQEPWPVRPRDIDVLFVGDWQSPFHRERRVWLARLAGLAERHRIVIRSGITPAEYRELLSRAKIVFNHSSTQGCNTRVAEALAAGSLLLQEAGNLEVPHVLEEGRDYLAYTPTNLETLIEHHLANEHDRQQITRNASQRLPHLTFESAWLNALTLFQNEQTVIQERRQKRLETPRTNQNRVECLSPAVDRSSPLLLAQLSNDPENPDLANLIGTLCSRPAEALEWFQRALNRDPNHFIAACNLIRAHLLLKQSEQARNRLLAITSSTEKFPDLSRYIDSAVYWMRDADFRAAWQGAACEHAGNRAAETTAKQNLLHAWLGLLTLQMTGRSREADSAVMRQLLGMRAYVVQAQTLWRARHPGEATTLLQEALSLDPLDQNAAQLYNRILDETNDLVTCAGLHRQQQLLRRAMEPVAPKPDWLEIIPETVPRSVPKEGLALPNRKPTIALCMIVRNEERNLPDCLGAIREMVDQVIVVDTGSTDRTKSLAQALGCEVIDSPWQNDFSAARNAGLHLATADWIFWLDADERLDVENLAKLRKLFAKLSLANVAYLMTQSSPSQDYAAHQTGVDQVRLFRNDPRHRWIYRIHEQIAPSIQDTAGRAEWTDIRITHQGYHDLNERRRKFERNLPLLERELKDRPDNPFTYFNLGTTYLGIRQPEAALTALQRSLQLAKPDASFLPSLYAMIVQTQRQLNDLENALQSCLQGRRQFANDTQLAFLEGQMRSTRREWDSAESCFQQCLRRRDRRHFGNSVDGLDGFRARDQLARIYFAQERMTEAESQWRAALADAPRFSTALIGLGHLYLRQKRWPDLEQNAQSLLGMGPEAQREAAIHLASMKMHQKSYVEARLLLTRADKQFPRTLRLKQMLADALLNEGDDQAAEQIFREILSLEPADRFARSRLSAMKKQRPGMTSATH